jgi:hypothetical protein
MKRMLFILLAGLTGCTTTNPTSNDGSALTAYMRCNRAASYAIAGQSEGPAALAVTARSMCGREQLAVQNALLGSMDEVNAMSVMRGYRNRILEDNVADIVKARMRVAPARAKTTI